MQRYFLGNNTGVGFVGLYEKELATKQLAILLKGGPGTGKSSMLKKLADIAKKRGEDFELWYCSGDPMSLDGIYVKDRGIAVIDATSPHAVGADLPVVKDVIFDLAQGLDKDKLQACRQDIEDGLTCKKKHFRRTYQHLNTALCHLHNQYQEEASGICESGLRAFATEIARQIAAMSPPKGGCAQGRRVFCRAICPQGESAYFDHLINKRVIQICAPSYAAKVFFEQLGALLPIDMAICNPLDASALDGVILGDVAVVTDCGPCEKYVVDKYDLQVFEKDVNMDIVGQEESAAVVEISLAVEQLNRAREAHLGVEKHFVAAMDFKNNDKILKNITQLVFGQ